MKKLLVFPNLSTSASLTATASNTCSELIWEEGRSISLLEFDLSNLEYICETLPDGKMTDFAVTDSGAPIISENIKKTFDTFKVKLQYFPVSIILKEGQVPTKGYYAININGLVDCIDFDKSDLVVEKEDGDIVDIIEVGTLELKNNSYGDIYRMHMFERVIVVEGKLAEKLEELNVSGMKLIRPNNWDGIASEKG